LIVGVNCPIRTFWEFIGLFWGIKKRQTPTPKLPQKRFAFAPVFPFVLVVFFVVSNPGNHQGHKEHEAEHEFVNNRC
jgi:hypothetical protein